MRTGCGSEGQVVPRGASGDQKLLLLLIEITVTR